MSKLEADLWRKIAHKALPVVMLAAGDEAAGVGAGGEAPAPRPPLLLLLPLAPAAQRGGGRRWLGGIAA